MTGPPFFVKIGAITLTNCAKQAILTRSELFNNVNPIPPKTKASSNE